jgi:hypothetical protein
MISNTDPFKNNTYLAFDGTSFRDLLVQRLNASNVFTDQNYTGSHLAALNDIVGYFYSTLVYYLNQSAAGSQFNETQIYENMNRLVRLISYSPRGAAGQTVGFDITVNANQLNLAAGNYTIPRYSYITTGGSIYSFVEDITFSVLGTDINETVSLPNQYFLHQGTFQEYPAYTAIGNSNEIIFLTNDNSQTLDHYYIDVYVKTANTNTWSQWTRTDSLLNSNNTDSSFEARLNENLRYEIKFGNGVNGKQLNAGDTVQIYYLNIDPEAEDLAAGALYPSYPVLFSSLSYGELISTVSPDYNKFLTANQLPNVILNNAYPSTSVVPAESVDEIRLNAPGIFRSQQKLANVNDFEFFINSQFGTILADVKAMGNDEYLSSHVSYLYNLGLAQPQLDNNVLFNQVNYANACNFNNVYVYLVPLNNQKVINPTQKQTILEAVNKFKIVTSQVVLMDPEYMDITFCVPGDQVNISTSPNYLLITKTNNSKRSDSAIQGEVINIFNNFFRRDNLKLGQSVNLLELNTLILNVDGVDRIETYSPVLQISVPGISVLMTDIKYPKYQQVYTQSIPLGKFQYILFNNTNLQAQAIIKKNNNTTIADF